MNTRMTEIEKLLIMEQLRAEELCTRKAQVYLNQSRDPAVQGILQQSIDRGQRHINMLSSLLQDAGATAAAGMGGVAGTAGMTGMSGH